MEHMVRREHFGIVAVALAATLLLAARGDAQTCTTKYNPAVPGEIVGCCNASGNTMANGTACIGQVIAATGRINTCWSGVCQSGVCSAPWTAVDSSGNHPRCVDPGNTCQIGECYGTGQCRNIDNSNSKGKLLRCENEPDENRCTKDCIEVAAATDPFGFTCNNEPDPLYFPNGFPCSLVSGANCEKGTCNGTGTCVGTGDITTCTGSMDECDMWECVDLDPVTEDPVCVKIGVPLGTVCDASDPNDCHDSRCDGQGDCRSHHEENEGNDCEYNKDPCHYGICSGSGGCNGNFLRATDFPCVDDGNACTADTCVNTGSASTCYHYGDPSKSGLPCASDGNVCTSDVCNATATCTHPTDSAMQNQACPIGYPCVQSATCQGSTCTPQTCNTTGVCHACAGAPSCVDNTSNYCGCQ
jgi:hypothetical protein